MTKKIKFTHAQDFKKNIKGDLKSAAIKRRDKRNPVRALARIIDDEYGVSDSGVYDEIHVGGKVYSLKNREPKTQYKPQKDRDVGPPKVKKAMGGVMRNRGGTFKGVY
tara:strand:- start:222 stop:545 length:324 start_codon:yes stop_codon:yes gene_type:complete